MRFDARMSDLISVRFSREERRAIDALARVRGCTISTVIRQMVAEAAQRAAA
jgi:hypothetical protein